MKSTNPTDLTKLACEYLTAYRIHKNTTPLLDTIQDIIKQADAGLDLIEHLVNQSTNDAELAFVAAGPFEELFLEHYKTITSTLDHKLRVNSKMRRALCGIWVNKKHPARPYLDNLLDKYHLVYGSL